MSIPAAYPRLDPQSIHTPPRPTRSVYDALTDLFLGDGVLAPALRRGGAHTDAHEGDDGTAYVPRHVQIEAIVLGNLPVLASAWITQYGRYVAQQTARPVAILRSRNGLITLDLIGGSDAEPGPDLNAALLGACASAATWLISTEQELIFHGLVGEGLIDRVTLLTGADEPAVVACYRTLKSLITTETGGPTPITPDRLRLAVMGAPPERAGDACERIERAAETFLSVRIASSVCIGKIGGPSAHTLFRGADERTIDELVDLVRSTAALPGSGVSLAPLAPSRSTPHPLVLPQTALTPRNDREPGTTMDASTRSSVECDASPEAIAAVPNPASAVTAHPTIAARQPLPSLSSHVLGLRSLAPRCPHAELVELAADADGRLHLLVRVEDNASSAVIKLLATSSWAVAHLGMLRASCADLRASAGEIPALHILTDSPKDVRGLLDTWFRVHLLTYVRIDEREHWICRDLN